MKHSWLYIAALLIIFSALFARQIMNRKEFLAKFYREIKGLDLKGFPAWLLAGLASYESGDGKGSLAAKGNNIFSLQVPAKGWTGAKILQSSTGNYFRAYSSYREAVQDFLNLLIGWPSNYAKAVQQARAGDYKGFAASLQSPLLGPKFAYGDPGKMTYASELIGRIEEFKA